MFNRLESKSLLFSCVILMSANAHSETNNNKQAMFLQLKPVLSVTAGAFISQLGHSQSFAPLDLCHYTYKSSDSMTTNMLWGGFIGSEIKHSPLWGFIAGLGYYQPSSLATKGTLTQGADLMSESTYNYSYQTQSQQLLAEGKLYWVAKEKIHPFLMMGIGAAFNKTSDYQTSIPPFLEFTPVFSNHTQTNFTYAIGPGVDLSLSQSLKFGVAYRFTDLGSANTGSAAIDEIPISNTLNQSHLYANQIIAQVTYTPWTN
jgi:opacity protein-like surface antigen